MKLKNKFFILIFSLVIFLACLSGALATWAQRQTVKEQAIHEGKKVALLAHALIESKMQSLIESAQVASADTVFRGQLGKTLQSDSDFGLEEPVASVNPADPANPEDNLSKVHQVLKSSAMPVNKKYEVLVFLTEKGIVLFSKTNPEKYGQKVSGLKIFQRAVHDNGGMDIWNLNSLEMRTSGLLANPIEKEYLIQATPIIAGHEILGYLIAGIPLEEGLLQELRNVSQLDLTMLTTLSPKEKFDFKQRGIALPKRGKSVEVDFKGENFLYLREDIGIGGFKVPLLIAYSLTEQIQKFSQHFAIGFLTSMGLAFLIVLTLGSFLSQSLTKPLSHLTEAVKEVGKGSLTVKLAVESRDEVGELTKAFNLMIDNLSSVRIDPMTGLFTESYFKDTLTHYLLTTESSENKAFVLFLKIKNLHEIHQKGGVESVNLSLVELTEILKTHFVQKGDLLAITEDHTFLYFSLREGSLASSLTNKLVDQVGKRFKLAMGAVCSGPLVHTSEDYFSKGEEAMEISFKSDQTRCVFAKGSLDRTFT